VRARPKKLGGGLVLRVLDRTTRRVEGGSHGTGFVEDMFTLEAPR